MQQKTFKKTILIDLDGVLNEYVGKYDTNFIPKPKNGVDKFLENLYLDFDLRLFTTRNKLSASKWLIENNLDKYFSDITNIKELSWLIIDDRCLKFEGNYEDLIQKINNFKAWYK
ncbi:hypothetical protein IKA15_04215 [bacterium]|nr:hypothetical protein [bacterium]